jgi:hypothetical protein
MRNLGNVQPSTNLRKTFNEQLVPNTVDCNTILERSNQAKSCLHRYCILLYALVLRLREKSSNPVYRLSKHRPAGHGILLRPSSEPEHRILYPSPRALRETGASLKRAGNSEVCGALETET